MRRFLFFLLVICFSVHQAPAQNLSNPSFDSLYFGGIDRVFDWITADGFIFFSGVSNDTVLALQPDTYYDAQGFPFSELLFSIAARPPYMGTGASLRLSSKPEERRKVNGAFFETFLTNGSHLVTDEEGYIHFSKGGAPFPYRPKALLGQYQFVDTLSAIDNFGKCVILLKKYNSSTGQHDTIGYTESTLDLNPTNNWRPFAIPVEYQSTETPDSIVVVFYAGNNPSEETELWLDELSFDFTTATNEVSGATGLPLIYPNPNSGWLHINAQDQKFSTFRLWDQSGKLLRSGEFQSLLSLRDFPGKTLLLQLITDKGKTVSVKVITE